MPKSSNKNLNVKIDGNNISTYNVAVMDNFNNLSVIINTQWKI